MSEIYKINHIENNLIKHIYIFTGGLRVEGENYGPNGNNFFNEEEWTNIKQQNIPTTIIPHFIHSDDTVITIKRKLVKFLRLNISTKEIYIFGVSEKVLNPVEIFNNLSQNEKIKVTYERICGFLENIIQTNAEKTSECLDTIGESKEEYTFDDLLMLNNFSWETPKKITFPVGQKLILKNPLLFTSNPYNVSFKDNIIQNEIENIVSTQNNNLLFEYGNLIDNNIFLCLADEVIEYSKTVEGITEKYMLSLFYPQLFLKENIDSLSELREKRNSLYEKEEQILNENFDLYNENIDMFYSMFLTKQNKLSYLQNVPGIDYIHFTIHPKNEIIFPLEILFKLIHSDKKIPMVKYNPGNKRENIYRFFTDNNVSENGKKIPYLYTINNNRKGLIIKLSKELATKKRVSYFIIAEDEDGNKHKLVCEFEQNGNINIICKFKSPQNIIAIEEILLNFIQIPILKKIGDYLSQSGYTFSQFTSLYENNIEFKDIHYVSSIVIRKNINLNNYVKCLSSAFTIFDGKFSSTNDAILLKYKRVSNYNEMNSQEAFINESVKKGLEPEEIIKLLTTNFKITSDEAQGLFAKWLSDVKTEKGLFQNKSFSVRTNTGFPVVLKRNNQNFETTIKVESINDIRYLYFIHIYIDGLLRLFLDKNSSDVSTERINRLCKGKKIEDINIATEEEDIEARVEQGLLDRADPNVNDDKVVFERDEEDQQDFLGMLLGDDDDDDSDEEDSEDDLDIEFGDEIDENENDNSKSKSKDTGNDDDFLDIEFGDEISSLNENNSASESKKENDESKKENEESEESKKKDSAKSNALSEADIDVTGLPLKGSNNIFIKKKLELQPELFINVPQGRFKAYSRACQASQGKQPIILTEKEKKYIDDKDSESNTKSYDEFITYGSKNKKYHYICPRFWCLSDEEGKSRSISFKEINEGKCGGWDALIPEGSSKVPKGKRIYEFTDVRYHKESVKTNNKLVYKPHYPGFFKPSKHKDGLCIPCCFSKPRTDIGKGEPIPYMYKPEGSKNPDGPGPYYETKSDGSIDLTTIEGKQQLKEKPAKVRIETFSQCDQGEEKKAEVITKKKKNIDMAPLIETFPLNPNQLGYLTLAEQKFLGFNCRKICMQSLSDKQLKKNTPCLLHKGMEKSENQSFLSCIADIFYYNENMRQFSQPNKLKNSIDMTIEQIKQILISNLTIDTFIELQNGTLVELFSNNNDEEKTPDIISISDSKFYKNIEDNLGDIVTDTFVKKVINAFENYKKFILSDSTKINHEFLWDYVTMPRGNKDRMGIFAGGLNLIIIRSPENDITNKIELICPSNSYSKNEFDPNKKTLILFNKGRYFEPIYKYTRVGKDKYTILKLFSLVDIQNEMPEIEKILHVIFHNLKTKCKPLPSLPEKYNKELNFRQPIELNLMINILKRKTMNYRILYQIVNYNLKVIGLYAINKGKTIYIPCAPSAINRNYEYTFVNNPNIIYNYKQTVDRLTSVYNKSKKEIPCKPRAKIVESNVIIGVLTETNQMVPTIPEPYQESIPEVGELDNLEVIHWNKTETNPENKIINSHNFDRNMLTNNSIDIERTQVVKQIKLESFFYNLFRNLARILLNHFQVTREKEEIKNIVSSLTINYYEKINMVINILKSIMQDEIEFVVIDPNSIENLRELGQCLNINSNECNSKPNCLLNESENKCIVKLPIENLINGSDNSKIYFTRLADEIIRYQKIRKFLLQPKSFLSFQKIPYNILSNEIILLEELLYGDYFENLVELKDNPFINTMKIYDLTEPAYETPYDDMFNLDINLDSQKISDCLEINNKKLTMGHWKKGRVIRKAYETMKNGKKVIKIKKSQNAPILNDFNLMEFKHTFQCSWDILTSIIKQAADPSMTNEKLKNILIDIYIDKMSSNSNEIMQILKNEGKKDQVKSIMNGTNLLDIITLNNYYISLFDIFLISEHFDISIIVLCRTRIPTFNEETVSFLRDKKEHCYMIFSGRYKNVNSSTPPAYGLLEKDDTIKIPFIYLQDNMDVFTKNIITTTDRYFSFMREKRPIKKIKKMSKLKRLVVKS